MYDFSFYKQIFLCYVFCYTIYCWADDLNENFFVVATFGKPKPGPELDQDFIVNSQIYLTNISSYFLWD